MNTELAGHRAGVLAVGLSFLFSSGLPAQAPTLGAFHVASAPPEAVLNLRRLVVSPDSRFLYVENTAWELDPATRLPVAERSDLVPRLASPDDQGDSWALVSRGTDRRAVERTFTVYRRTPAGTSTASQYAFFVQTRDPESGAFGAPQSIGAIPATSLLSLDSAATVSADGMAFGVFGTVRNPYFSVEDLRLVVASREDSGQYVIRVEDPPGARVPPTSSEPPVLLVSGRAALGIVYYNTSLSILSVYANDPVSIPAWAHVMPIYWQRQSIPPSVTRLFVDAGDDRLVLAPDRLTGIVQTYRWSQTHHALAHERTLFDPRLVSTTIPAQSGDGDLLATAYANTLRLWQWNRETRELTLADEKSYPFGRFIFEGLALSSNGRLIHAVGRTQGTTGDWLLAAIPVDRGPAKSDAVRALLTGEEIPPAFDANQDDVFDAADVLKLVP